MRTPRIAAALALVTAAACGAGHAPDAGDARAVDTGARDADRGTDVVADAGLGRDAAVDAADGSNDAARCTTGAPDASVAPPAIDVACFTVTFDDEFTADDIASGPLADGMHPDERWFNGTEQCCLSPSDHQPAVNYPTPGPDGPVDPYSLLPGGGLRISLQDVHNEWYSGVMTSVDAHGDGFSQRYGYFEIDTKLPAGTGTWPSFWMLSLPVGAAGGEIDVFEQYGCNPPQDPACERIFWTTLHDWTNGTTPGMHESTALPDLTADYHRYGLLWNATYMAVYLDGQLLWSTPTPAVMNRPYYLLVDLGLGSGFDTTQTPSPSNMDIRSVRAYTVPGF